MLLPRRREVFAHVVCGRPAPRAALDVEYVEGRRGSARTIREWSHQSSISHQCCGQSSGVGNRLARVISHQSVISHQCCGRSSGTSLGGVMFRLGWTPGRRAATWSVTFVTAVAPVTTHLDDAPPTCSTYGGTATAAPLARGWGETPSAAESRPACVSSRLSVSRSNASSSTLPRPSRRGAERAARPRGCRRRRPAGRMAAIRW